MNINDKDLAIKLFDYFFKKAGVINVKVFDRTLENTRALKLFPKGSFGLNVGVYFDNLGFYIIRGLRTNNNQNLMTFYASESYAGTIRTYHYHFQNKNFKLAEMPNKLKEAVVKSCIDQKTDCTIYSKNYRDSITLIPQASSLEELAIKMELET